MNEKADDCCIVEPSESWTAQEEQVLGAVEKLVGPEKIDAIICVAGGWAGGNAANKGINSNIHKKITFVVSTIVEHAMTGLASVWAMTRRRPI